MASHPFSMFQKCPRGSFSAGRDRLAAVSGLERMIFPALLALAAAVAPSRADSVWTGLSGADWRNASNWSGGVPTSAVTATIANGGSAFALTGPVLAATSLTLGGSGGSGGFSLGDDGAVTFTTTQTSGFGNGGNSGIMQVKNGSTWNSTGADLVIGASDYGELDIYDGSTVQDTFALVGRDSGSTGAVVVDGTGATWAQTNGVVVGLNGTGSLTVSGGGAATNLTDGEIGFAATAIGTVAVTTHGSWTVGDPTLFVGVQGQGDLVIASQGTVKVGGGTGDLRLGDSGAGSGVLSIGGGYDRTGTNPVDDDLAGTLLAASVTGGTGTGTKLVNFNLSDAHYSFTPVLAGSLSVQNIGSGTTVLTATSTYTGTTTVSNGQLVVDGSISGSSLTTVSGTGLAFGANGILSGRGTIGAVAVAAGGTIAPGDTVGTLTTGAETWNGGGTYVWQINNATGTPGGTNGWDLLSINGSLTLAGPSGTPFTLAIQSLTSSDLAGNVPNFNPSVSQIWVFASSTGGITGFNPADIRIDTSGFTNTIAPAGTWSVRQSGNNLVLNYSPIPEPATWAFSVSVLLGCVILHRRRNQFSAQWPRASPPSRTDGLQAY